LFLSYINQSYSVGSTLSFAVQVHFITGKATGFIAEDFSLMPLND